LLLPECRGRVSLRSADPAEPPRIELPDPHLPADLARLVEGARRVADVLGQPALRKVLAGPAPSFESDVEVVSAVEAGWYSVPHVVGTCAMGPSGADGAVVDADARVHGIDGLRVVDASIIPLPPSGFTHLPTIMLAEHLAARIAGAA
jgi:choline dehydrogenase